MKFLLSILITFYTWTSIFGQYYVDTLIYQNDSVRQTKNYVAFADSNFIYIFGENDIHGIVRPYMMKYDFRGEFISQNYRSAFSSDIWVATQILQKKNNSRYYIFSQDNFSDGSGIRLGEVDVVTGKTIRNEINLGLPLVSAGYDGVNTVYALGSGNWYEFSTNEFMKTSAIVSYDTNVVFQNSATIWEGVQDIKTSPFFLSVNKIEDERFEVLGLNLWYASNRDKLDTVGIHRWIFNTNGKLLHKSVIPDGYGSVLSGHYALIKGNSGQRIMGMRKYRFNEATTAWENNFRITAFSSSFDTLLWSTHLFSTRDKKNNFTRIRGVCASHNQNGYVAMSDWTDTLSKQRQGQIFKVSNTGDLLWKRSITPSSYNANEAKSLRFNNISSTPYGYLIIGDYYKKNEGAKSFMMHTDQYGCLVPGCQRTVGSEDIQRDDELAFEIFPNPVQSQIYILSRIDSREKHIINLYNMNGDELLQSDFYPQRNAQIMLLLPGNIESGMHVLVIRDEQGKSVWRKSVIVQ